MPCRDDAITPALLALRNCAATELGNCGRPVCHFPIVWNGGHPPADACDCTCTDGDGQAWVRMVTLNRGPAGNANATPCFNNLYDVTVELGVYRCSPVPLDGQATVPEEKETTHALGMLLDAYALRRAALCCPWFHDQDIVPVLHHESAIGPSGGCVGVELQVQFVTNDPQGCCGGGGIGW